MSTRRSSEVSSVQDSERHYKLSWANHQPNFIGAFTVFLNNGMLCDCALSAEGQQIPAHRVVLGACSNYFLDVFTQSTGHPVILIHDISFMDLRVLVDFMYFGEVNVALDRLKKIVTTGKILKIKGIMENADHLDINNICNAEEPRVKNETLLSSSRSTAYSSQSMNIPPYRPTMNTTDPSISEDRMSNLSVTISGDSPAVEIVPEIILTEDPNDSFETRYTPPSARRKRLNLSARRREPRNEPNFKMALEVIRNGEMGFCKAARIYGVNNRTLWLEYRRLGYPVHRQGPARRPRKQE